MNPKLRTWLRGLVALHLTHLLLSGSALAQTPVTATASNEAHALITLANTSPTASATVQAKKRGNHSVSATGAASGSLVETVSGAAVPFSFTATSGAGPTPVAEFTIDIAAGSVVTIDLGTIVQSTASATSADVATWNSAATSSLTSTFSLENASAGDATVLVSFRPTTVYGLTATGTAPPARTGEATTSLFNSTTGESFTDRIAGGTRSVSLLDLPVQLTRTLAPGDSVALVAGFSVSALASIVPEPTSGALLAAGCAGLAARRRCPPEGPKRASA